MKNPSSPIVSVIVAAYNAESHIVRCLDSIAGQTFKDFEVIIIDDGSKDRTGIIADEYALRDPRFYVLHQKNGGVAAARQTGLNHAIGEYTIHIDTDDWAAPNMLSELVSFAMSNSLDMVICDFYEIDNNSHLLYNHQRPEPSDRISIFGQMLNTLSGSLWNKLIRRSCYFQYGISFEKDINYEEDKLVCLKLLSHDVTVGYLHKALYYYDLAINSQSLSILFGTPRNRLNTLKTIETYCDISPVQQYFDNAVFYIAYQALSLPKSKCPDFQALFFDYQDSLKRARGFRWYTKILVLLRLHGVSVPSPGRLRYVLFNHFHL